MTISCDEISDEGDADEGSRRKNWVLFVQQNDSLPALLALRIIMSHHPSYAYAGLLTAGGVAGYVKGKSVPSLGALSRAIAIAAFF
jgi:Transmembrane proteins 14C